MHTPPTAAQAALDQIAYASVYLRLSDTTDDPRVRADAHERIRLLHQELDRYLTAQAIQEAPPCRD